MWLSGGSRTFIGLLLFVICVARSLSVFTPSKVERLLNSSAIELRYTPRFSVSIYNASFRLFVPLIHHVSLCALQFTLAGP
uniref:Putative secreted protein n=1 Tax=Anopheles darlingi TaxID=43151 RepID=A0A2M4DBL9_ANODA